MRTSTPKIRLLFYGFCLATVLYNCKTKDVAGVTPFTYTFKGIDNVKLPEVKATTPAAVTVTAGSVQSSTVTSAVTSGLASLSSGQPSAAVQQATADVAKAIPADQATQLAAAFTPAVVASISSGGSLPANLKSQTDALAKNPALQAYMPKYTLPTVNGKPVGGRIGADGKTVVPVTANATTKTNDACQDAANASYNTAVANLTAARDAQVSSVNATHQAQLAAAQQQATSCNSEKNAYYANLLSQASSQYNEANTAISGASISESDKALLKVLYLVSYVQISEQISTVKAAEIVACNAAATAVQNASTADTQAITANFNAAMATLNAARTQAINSCHNQGGGRIGAE